MNLTDIMLSKRNTEVSVQTKGIKMIESKLVVTSLVERDGELVSRKGYKETFWRAKFYILIWVLVTWVCTYVKSHWVVHLRSVHVTFCTFLDYF